MRMEIDKMYYGNYRFITELDTGSETGANQLTIWVAEKPAIDTVPLAKFQPDQLLKALLEPHKTRLTTLIEAGKSACRKPFEDEIAQIQQSSTTITKKGKKKLPHKAKQQIDTVRKQMEKELRQLEKEFAQRELITLERQCFDRDILQNEYRTYENEHLLRDFYFEEANDKHMRNFCRKFASDEAYRREVLAGETHWARRNALFVRNLPSLYSATSSERDYDSAASDFFYWLDKRVEEIIALPEYQRLQQIDSTFEPCASELDPLIRPTVEVFNRVPGVTTRFSCQGVSGKVSFQDRELLVVSPHQEHAYISFSALGQMAHDIIVSLLHEFPSITTSNAYSQVVLRSTGDNLRFREEILSLANRLLESIDEEQSDQSAESSDLTGKFVTQTVPLPQGTSLPGGLLPSRLDWLCQPQQIERTLYLLFYLNHWAKAHEDLLYDDRQGLYEVKALLLQKAYEVGAIRPAAYIDGTQLFAQNYHLEMAASMATEIFLDRLDDVFDQAARQLFKRIAGFEATIAADVEKLDEQQIETYIHERLQELIKQAQSTCQPIPTAELEALFIEPGDLLEIHWSWNRSSPMWNELDESEARKLDPEGLSLIAFLYNSPTAHYTFHLPFRIAEAFLPAQCVQALKNDPADSREAGVFYGQALTEAESWEHPIRDILRELLVDIAAICPHNLIDKQEHIRELADRRSYWHDWDDDDDDYDDDDDWDYEDLLKIPVYSRPKKEKNQHECPLCGTSVNPEGLPRIEHWRQAHQGQDLTISHVAWISGKSKADLKSATPTIPPDYRGPSTEPGANGTRIWKLESIEAAIKDTRGA
jgi:hypothetical protein